MADAARELARKVAASIGASVKDKLTLAPNPVNLSSVAPVEFQRGWDAFRDEIEEQSNAFRPASSQEAQAVSVGVTLSENLGGLLWIAQVTQGATQENLLVSFAREPLAEVRESGTSITLSKQFLVSQPEPILDVNLLAASPASPPNLLVLQPDGIALFTQQNGTWQLQSEAPIAHATPWPRDTRGRLQTVPDEEAVLPGVVCSIKTNNAVTASCHPGSTGWLFSPGLLRSFTTLPMLVANRNVFTLPRLGSQVFYAIAAFAAPAASGGTMPVIATTSDGQALLFEGSSIPAALFSDWGSDIAALYSSTRTRWPFLVTGTGDWTGRDSVQAFEIAGHRAVQVSAEINFDGPVTALWTEGENTALVVSRNPKTGMYEAYLLRATFEQ